jgi:hypothetical protein
VISAKTKVDTLITAHDDCVKVDVRMTDGRVNSIEVSAYAGTKWHTVTLDGEQALERLASVIAEARQAITAEKEARKDGTPS